MFISLDGTFKFAQEPWYKAEPGFTARVVRIIADVDGVEADAELEIGKMIEGDFRPFFKRLATLHFNEADYQTYQAANDAAKAVLIKDMLTNMRARKSPFASIEA